MSRSNTSMQLGAAFAAIALFIEGTAGIADANVFGLRYWGALSTYGNFVAITVPTPSQQSIKAPDFFLNRTVEQSSDANPGLIQAGLYISGANVELDNCGSSNGANLQFLEYKPDGSSTYTCGIAGSVSSPNTENYNVYVGTFWYVRINGGVVDQASLGIHTAQGGVGGELFSSDGSRQTPSFAATV